MCAAYWCILMFKMASKPSAEMLSSVPQSKKAVMGLRENTCWTSFIQVGDIVLLAVNPLLGLLHILTTVSLNKNRYKYRSVDNNGITPHSCGIQTLYSF